MEIKKIIKKIEKHYLYHGAHIKLKLLQGTDISRRLIFRIDLKPGTKANLIFERASDIQMALQMQLFQPFKDGLILCLAVSQNEAIQNSLLLMLKSKMFCQNRDWLPIAIGYNMRQEMIFDDLAKMPHIMYAGSTNSGKSVGLLCLICSLIIKQPVRAVNLLIFDIGANSLGAFSDIPHLSHPIIKDEMTGRYVIDRLVEEMERRIELSLDELRKLPAIICVIDEYVSFVNGINDKKKSKELTDNISSLIRRGRHAKIHMVIATQDPVLRNMKVDVGNITTRLAFKCAKYHNSIAILGEGGAEKLSGNGSLLYKSSKYPNPVHLQGAFISSNEIDELVESVKSKEQNFDNKFVISELDRTKSNAQDYSCKGEVSDDRDKEFVKIVIWVLGRKKISASQIMSCFTMGNRAYNIVEQLCEMKIVDEKFANQPRKVIPACIEDLSPEIISLLERYGYSTEYIEDVFGNRSGQKCYGRF